MSRVSILTISVLLAIAVAGGSTATASTPHAAKRCALPQFGPGSAYRPHLHRASFGPDVTNPWFPLHPGTTFVYQGGENGDTLIDVFAPSRHTKLVDGVRTRIVHDRLYRNGVLSERTTDYYAQDGCGNVWYFGEDTAELDEHGRVTSTDGTWHAGSHGAQPGVYMQAHPRLGRPFRQEWAAGVAEDQFVAVAKHQNVRTPYGAFRDALRTRENTALEPGVVDRKVYVFGVGEAVERTLRGGSELLKLVDVLR